MRAFQTIIRQVVDEQAFSRAAMLYRVVDALLVLAGIGAAVAATQPDLAPDRAWEALALIEDSIAKAGGGRVKVDQVGSSLRSMTAEFATIKNLIDEIQQGSIEQSRGVEQISNAITQMEQMTQRTAANSQQGAASSAELNAQAESLQNVVDRLRIMVDGEVAGGPGRPAALASSARSMRSIASASRPEERARAGAIAAVCRLVAEPLAKPPLREPVTFTLMCLPRSLAISL